MLRRTFHRLDVNLTRLLYCIFVRPRLEFCSTVWNPNHKGDIELIEKVQRRATKIPHETKRQNYKQRIIQFNLQNLKERRDRDDFIQQYKFINGLDKINWHKTPCIAASISTNDPASAIQLESQEKYQNLIQYTTSLQTKSLINGTT